MSLETALWALLAFQIKHYLCDFVLQSGYQVRTKGIYGHPGGFIHSGLHVVTSIPGLLILGADVRGIAIAMVAEFVVHYHTDWTKSQIDSRTKWGFDDARHWMVFGADQLIHQLTYWGMICVFAFGL